MRVPGGIGWEIVSDEGGLDRLAAEWEALDARCASEGFFTRMEILRANWERYRKDGRTALHVAAIRDRGRLVMGMPMIRRRELFGTHSLLWLDSRTPFYDGLLLDPAMETAAAAAVLLDVLHASLATRIFKVGFVHEGTALHRVLDAAGMPLVRKAEAASLDIAGYPTFEAHLAAMPARRRQQIGNFGRRLRKAGAGPVHAVTDPQERSAEIARLFARKRQWVEEEGLSDWIVPAATEAWFQRIAAREDARNRTHLLRLASGEDWIASILAFERDGTLYLSKMAHNPAWERFSPGWVLLAEVVRFAIERRLGSIDFMIGSSAWKNRLADRHRAVFGCRANLLPWRRRRG
ncbi:GNAT family N-acetyltransferase [Aquibium microcysteis]|uniref:GNAT family N-acetyltransferase n=1 Tax=Aquibium microcysteis TaxID=675281 RepID=UPI00165D1452|nr:GNAT family N-acetyltransferase [Aquibium microcysteis]